MQNPPHIASHSILTKVMHGNFVPAMIQEVNQGNEHVNTHAAIRCCIAKSTGVHNLHGQHTITTMRYI